MEKPLAIAVLIAAYAVSSAYARDIPPPGPDGKCGFVGNGDMYGLGIRLGAFATTVSGAYRQDSARGISFANGFFQFAMFLALLYMTVTAYRDLEVIEAAIIILFSFCSVSISNPEEQAFKRPQRYNFQGIRSWLRHSFVPFGKMLIDLALNCYWLWFWIVGMEQLTLSPCTGYGFFFAQVSLFGWFRTLGKIVTSMMVVLDLFIIGRVLFYGKPLPKWFVKITEPRIRGEEPCFDCAGDFFGFMVSIAIVGFYVMSVELMIRWNGIQGVSTVFGSVGQMIPFLVGMGSLVAVILEWNVKPSCVGCKLVIGEDGKPLDTEVEKGALGPRATKRVLTGMSGKTMTTSRSNTGLSEKMPVPTRSTTGLSGKTMMGSRSNTGLSEMTTEPSRIAGLSERLRTQLAKEMLNRGLSKDSPSRRVTKRNTATSPGETSTTEQQPTGSIATEDEVTTIEQSEPEEDVREKAA